LLTNDPTDFIGLAQTGTGKTAAFGLPLIDLIDEDNPATQALIMAPTRELGQQTAEQLKSFSKKNKGTQTTYANRGGDTWSTFGSYQKTSD
jgi:ATP-dependent RNA helicase DeaD